MRVAIANTYARSGGAALAASRLFQGLRRIGVDASFYSSFRDTQSADLVSLPDRLNAAERWERAQRDAGLEEKRRQLSSGRDLRWTFTLDEVAPGPLFTRHLPPADVVNLHWIAEFLDYRSFFALGIPTVWTLHDTFPMTGGCHYPNSCRRFEEGCGACPLLGASNPEDESAMAFRRKRAAIAERTERMRVVTPSRWLAEEVRRSAMFQDVETLVIPNGLDVGRFQPWPRDAARRELGLPDGSWVIVFVADDATDRRKGFLHLDAALARSPDPADLVLVTVGSKAPTVMAERITHRHVPHVGDPRGLSILYSAADVVAAPTLQDNLPNVILEAFACGVPVIGSDVGGVPDLVRPGETGRLVPPADPDAFAAAISDLRSMPERRAEMGHRALAFVRAEHSIELQAQRYRAVFEELVAAVHSRAEPR